MTFPSLLNMLTSSMAWMGWTLSFLSVAWSFLSSPLDRAGARLIFLRGVPLPLLINSQILVRVVGLVSDCGDGSNFDVPYVGKSVSCLPISEAGGGVEVKNGLEDGGTTYQCARKHRASSISPERHPCRRLEGLLKNERLWSGDEEKSEFLGEPQNPS